MLSFCHWDLHFPCIEELCTNKLAQMLYDNNPPYSFFSDSIGNLSCSATCLWLFNNNDTSKSWFLKTQCKVGYNEHRNEEFKSSKLNLKLDVKLNIKTFKCGI